MLARSASGWPTRVWHKPLGVAARTEDFGLEAAVVAARNGRLLVLARHALVGGRGRLREIVKGTDELLKGARGAVEVPRELVWMNHPAELQIRLALLCKGRRRVDLGPE